MPMNRNARIVVALAIGMLLGLGAMWLQGVRSPGSVSMPGETAALVSPPEIPPEVPPVEVLAESGDGHVVALQENKQAAPVLAQGPTPEKLFPTANLPTPGYFRKPMSADFDIYLQFMGIAGASETSEEQLVQNFQALYELTDGELVQLIEVGTEALQADRAFQTAGMKAICDRGETFSGVEQLGAALNELNNSIEANQEELGRKAMQQLDPVVSSRIRQKVLHRPRGDVGTGDLAVIMAMRNHGLETELERVCRHAK